MSIQPSRVLVVANETVESDALLETLWFLARGGRTEVLVVAPALNSRLRHWVSDEDEARRAADRRLRHCLDRLEAAGVEARGWVGDADPLQAIDDVLAVFEIDEIVIATHPRRRSHWLARDVVERARGRFAGPVLHLVEDPVRRALAA